MEAEAVGGGLRSREEYFKAGEVETTLKRREDFGSRGDTGVEAEVLLGLTLVRRPGSKMRAITPFSGKEIFLSTKPDSLLVSSPLGMEPRGFCSALMVVSFGSLKIGPAISMILLKLISSVSSSLQRASSFGSPCIRFFAQEKFFKWMSFPISAGSSLNRLSLRSNAVRVTKWHREAISRAGLLVI